jgi:hypothetical protein
MTPREAREDAERLLAKVYTHPAHYSWSDEDAQLAFVLLRALLSEGQAHPDEADIRTGAELARDATIDYVAIATGAPLTQERTSSGATTKHWAVRVDRNGENILTIESAMLAGKPEFTPEDEQCIRDCAQHLSSFIGSGAVECFCESFGPFGHERTDECPPEAALASSLQLSEKNADGLRVDSSQPK